MRSKIKTMLWSFVRSHVPVEIRNSVRYKLPRFIHCRHSYSQCGEDLIVDYVLECLHGDRRKTYLDVGANHPYLLSNTVLLYFKGASGVLVEPDPTFARLLGRKRPRDKVLPCGVHFSGEMQAQFYVFDSPTLNTFSHQEKERYISMGHRLVDTLLVNLVDINTVLEMAGNVDFLNLDIEGLDEEILRRIDWQTHRPTCICVETISYETKDEPRKLHSILDYMAEQDYMLYADTFINSIFVDRRQWVAKYGENSTANQGHP